jgi:hypothetical protein
MIPKRDTDFGKKSCFNNKLERIPVRSNGLRVMAVLVTSTKVLASKKDVDAPDKPAHDASAGLTGLRDPHHGRCRHDSYRGVRS